MRSEHRHSLSQRARHCHTTVAGSDIQYWDYQPDPLSTTGDTTPQTLISVHGFRGTHHGLESIHAHLGHLRIIAPDLPGFGASPPLKERPHTVATYAELLAGFVETVAPGPVGLLGHSFGAVIAAYCAASHRELFTKLVLVNPIAEPPRGLQKFATSIAGLYYWLGRRLPGASGRALLSSRILVDVITALMVTTCDEHLRHVITVEHHRHFSTFANPHMLQEAYRESVRRSVSNVADNLCLPTLLIAGARDAIAPLAGQRRLLPKLPQGRLEIIPQVGHLVHYETPEAAAELIRDFLGL